MLPKAFRMLFATLMLIMFYGCGSSGPVSWKSPDYQPIRYEKVLVYVNTNDGSGRRMLEEAMVDELKRSGIPAAVTYNDIVGEYMQSAEKIGAKAIDMGGDGLLVFSGVRMGSEYRRGPSVNASVGVPVRIGFANVWLGGNIPLAGGGKTIPIEHIDASFYNKSGTGPFWTMKVSEKVTANVNASIAAKVASQLKRDIIL